MELSVEIKASPVRVWKCLTTIEDLRAWFGNYTTYEARAGGRWVAEHGKDVVESGVIRVFQPYRRLEQTWKTSEGGPELLTIFSIKANPRGTHLAVREEGAPESEKVTALWRRTLDNLKTYAEMKGFPAVGMVGSEGGATS